MGSKVMYRLAQLISLLSNPLIVLFPVPFLLIYRVNGDIAAASQWTFITFIFVLLVAIYILLNVEWGKFSDFDVSKREQRPVLFHFSGIIVIFYTLSLLVLNGPRVLYITVFGIILGVILLSFINQYIKASIHLATLTSVLVMVIIFYKVSLLSLFLIPIVAWSRIKINRHSLMETITGTVFGFLLTLLMYTTLKYVMGFSL